MQNGYVPNYLYLPWFGQFWPANLLIRLLSLLFADGLDRLSILFLGSAGRPLQIGIQRYVTLSQQTSS